MTTSVKYVGGTCQPRKCVPFSADGRGTSMELQGFNFWKISKLSLKRRCLVFTYSFKYISLYTLLNFKKYERKFIRRNSGDVRLVITYI